MIIPIPKNDEPEPELIEQVSISRKQEEWIKWYWFCKDWKCSECSAVNFGREKECVYCRMRLNRHTARPVWYVEEPYAG